MRFTAAVVLAVVAVCWSVSTGEPLQSGNTFPRGVQLGSGLECSSSNHSGTVEFRGGVMRVCSGTSWVPIDVESVQERLADLENGGNRTSSAALREMYDAHSLFLSKRAGALAGAVHEALLVLNSTYNGLRAPMRACNYNSSVHVQAMSGLPSDLSNEQRDIDSATNNLNNGWVDHNASVTLTDEAEALAADAAATSLYALGAAHSADAYADAGEINKDAASSTGTNAISEAVTFMSSIGDDLDAAEAEIAAMELERSNVRSEIDSPTLASISHDSGSLTLSLTYSSGQWMDIMSRSTVNNADGYFVVMLFFYSSGKGGAIYSYRAAFTIALGRTTNNNDEIAIAPNGHAHALNNRAINFQTKQQPNSSPSWLRMQVVGESATDAPLTIWWYRL